jgi:hypothetical protein
VSAFPALLKAMFSRDLHVALQTVTVVAGIIGSAEELGLLLGPQEQQDSAAAGGGGGSSAAHEKVSTVLGDAVLDLLRVVCSAKAKIRNAAVKALQKCMCVWPGLTRAAIEGCVEEELRT